MSARKIPMPTRGQQQQQPDGGGGGGRPSNAVGGVNAQAEGRTAGNGGGGGGAGTGQGGGGGGAGGGAWASSLDIVFSFSRSAAFFGENLPSGPSFVDSTKFQRPTGSANAASGGTGDGGTESGPSAGDSRRRRRRGGGEDSSTAHTTTDDDDDEEEDDSDEDVGEHSDDWAGAQGLDEAAIDSWEDHVGLPSQHSHEQLPSNAILPTTARRGRGPGRQTSRGTARPRIPSAVPRGAESSASSFDSSHNQLSRSMPSFSSQSNANSLLSPPQIGLGGAAQPGERTPLVSSQRSQRLSPTFAPTTRPPRFSRHLSDPLLAGGSPTKSRRLSIVSAELWQEALEETRGKSTWGQTLFNTVNVLIGVGLLAEPLAFADAGWIMGTVLLSFCALITNYTAKILAKMMASDHTLQTYADVLVKAYGQRAKTFIYGMFVLELGALSIALVVLFADSMESLFPAVPVDLFKIAFFFIILPTTFVPLRFLSITSIIGIISTLTLLSVIIADGSLKHLAPGSLSDPMPTSVGPNWMRLPLSFGLLMSGFSGHAVVPSLYRDMKNPSHFPSMINTAYIIAFTVSMLFGVLGYVMFGNEVSSEVTRDLIKTKGNPVVLNKVAVWMVALNPVVKYAIANAPLVQTFEIMIGLQPIAPSRPPATPILNGSAIASEGSSSSISASRLHLTTDLDLDMASSIPRVEPFHKRYSFLITRPLLTATAVVLAIVIPDFARVLSFLGSASAFIICCIGPIGAHLILSNRRRHKRRGMGYKRLSSVHVSPLTTARSAGGALLGGDVMYDELNEAEAGPVVGLFERVACWFLLVLSIIMATVGTVWAFLPLDE